nr:hypothetical protein 2 [signal crayfish associated toti-like virus 1]
MTTKELVVAADVDPVSQSVGVGGGLIERKVGASSSVAPEVTGVAVDVIPPGSGITPPAIAAEVAPREVTAIVSPVEATPPGVLEPNPGTEPSTAVPSSAVSELVKVLVGAAGFSTSLDRGGGYVERAAVGWRTDRTVVKGQRNRREQTRYPSLGCMGVSRYAYGYVNNGRPAAARQHVNTHLAYDPDLRWRAVQVENIPRHPAAMQESIAKALSNTEDRIDMISKLTRMRGWFYEGKVAMSLAETMIQRGVEQGFSAFSPLAKLIGYLLSITCPADDGLIGTASIPATSLAQYGQPWWPGHPWSGAVLGQTHAVFTTGQSFRDWLNGQAVLAHGGYVFSPADIGRRVVVVPTPLCCVKQSRALLWLTIAHLQYPFKNIKRRGVMRDWSGDLLVPPADGDGGAQPAPFENEWYPTSSLVSLNGVTLPTAAGHESVMVVYVLTEEFPNQAAVLNLTFEAAVPVVLPIGPMGQPPVQWDGAFTALAARDPAGEVPALVEAQRILFMVEGAALDIADVVRFWQVASHVMSPASEGVDQHWDSLIGPEHADARNYIPRGHLRPSTTVLRRSAPYMPVNTYFAWPGLVYGGAGVPVAAEPTCVHYEVRAHDQLMAVGLAFGLVHLTSPSPEGCEPLVPAQLLPTVIAGAFHLATAVDLLLTANGATRSYLWYGSRGAIPPHVAMNLAEAQDAFWGRAGDPTRSEGAPMGPALSKLFFPSGAVRLWHPANGVVLARRAAELPLAYADTATVMLGRIDLPTLCQFSGLSVLSSSSDVDLTFLDFVSVTRDALRMHNDLATPVPDPAEADMWDKSWRVAIELDGVRANLLGIGVYDLLRFAPRRLRQEQSHVPLLLYTCANWGGLLSVAPGAQVQGMIAFEPTAWVLSCGRPIGCFDPRYLDDVDLLTRDFGIAYTTGWYASYKPAYYVPSISSRWNSVYSGSKTGLRRRVFKV